MDMKRTGFGHWLYEKRIARRWSQADLEREAGLSERYASRLEGKAKAPQDEVRERIHKALGTSDDDLVQAGILERIDTPGYGPVYVPAAQGRVTAFPISVAETQARYDEAAPQLRLRLRTESLTDAQAEALLTLLDTFAPE